MALLSEMRSVRESVAKERKWFSRRQCTDHKMPKWLDMQEQKSRKLLYLFVRDLLVGVNGKILDDKFTRDRAVRKRVSWECKIVAWAIIILTNVALLFYVYLFAMQQTSQRQAAVSHVPSTPTVSV